MGHYKPGGLCWSRDCTALGTVEGGRDTEGNEVRFCPECDQRIQQHLLGLAQKFALEAAEPPPGKPKN